MQGPGDEALRRGLGVDSWQSLVEPERTKSGVCMSGLCWWADHVWHSIT